MRSALIGAAVLFLTGTLKTKESYQSIEWTILFLIYGMLALGVAMESTGTTDLLAQTLTRLANMGVPPFNIASSVLLIMAQRLARRLCPHCKEAESVPREALLEEGFGAEDIEAGLTIYRPVGCDRCTDGYRGRVGIFQVMEVSEEIGRLIMEGGNALQLADQARLEGAADLRDSGLRKVKAGITSLEEINRVTKD